jgi:branched-chain amino acid transport system permease protein
MLKNPYNLLIAGILAVLLVLPAVVTQSFYLHILILVFMYALLGGAWNILGGYAGQVSLGHALYFGIGAYSSTMLMLEAGLSPWIGMVVGMFLSVAVSVLLGYPCFRIRGHYFVIATIALGEIAFVLFTNWEWVGGAVGRHIPLLPSSFANFQFSGKTAYYYIALSFLVIQLAFIYAMQRSYLGYYFQAIREDEDTARSLGINITKYKITAMAFSAAFMAAGGTFYAQYLLYIDPESVLPSMLSTQVCLIPILGGLGTVFGPVIGAFVMFPMSEFIRASLGGSGNALDLIIYGLLIMIFAIAKPTGIMGVITEWIGPKIQASIGGGRQKGG